MISPYVDMKLGCQRKGHEGQVVIIAPASQPMDRLQLWMLDCVFKKMWFIGHMIEKTVQQEA